MKNNCINIIGNTPAIVLEEKNGKKLIAKLEYYNPTGSIKDRASYYMIKSARDKKIINKDTIIIEATSGNTGIGLSMVSSCMGLKCKIVMPENMSQERIKLMKAYGSEIVLTKKELGMQGAIDKAKELHHEIPNSFIPDQFSNPANCLAHFETTAPEIFNNFPDVDWFCAGFGSGGTVMGIKQYIIANDLKTKVCAIEPKESPLVSSGKFGPHQIQGIGANFVPALLEKSKIDKFTIVSGKEAIEATRKLAKNYGIFGGFTTGANYAIAKKMFDQNFGTIVFVAPDNGSRYLSDDLYE